MSSPPPPFSLFILFSSKPSNNNNIIKIPPPPTISFPLYPRRYFKIPIMSFHTINNLKTKNLQFGSPQSLSEWLKPRLNSECFASWGVKPGTKNVDNLWLELSEGETILDDSIPPVRTVEVVVVKVVRSDFKVLIESHQELSDGVVRARGRPLSEKMKPGESVEGAVYRAVKEELGSVVGRFDEGGSDGVVKIVKDSYFRKVEERVSLSYPGLPACYVLHTVDVTVEGLPEGEFCTDEGDEYGEVGREGVADRAVSCKKHYWKWVDPDTIGN
ncbi:hypothetical protein LIER_12642 [Lithospermum erythrorhizon]|uniref:Nudix hydrolase domain-containing protein n=1 Tax=Lithospermum erythrorhizon TaxID=34254 RepID=A0AAV3PUD3_LITER